MTENWAQRIHQQFMTFLLFGKTVKHSTRHYSFEEKIKTDRWNDGVLGEMGVVVSAEWLAAPCCG